jgi:hypothetical protein
MENPGVAGINIIIIYGGKTIREDLLLTNCKN